MAIKRRVGQAATPKPSTANRRPAGEEGASEVDKEVIRSASTIFKDRIRTDQADATAGRRLGLPFSIGPVLPVHIRKLNAMFYGYFGFGKTSLAASADDVASMRDVLFINTDEGTMSITSRRTMDFVLVTAYDQIARIFEFMSLHCYYRDMKPRNIEKLLEYERDLKATIIPIEDQTPDEDGNLDPERTWFVEQRLRSGKPMDEPYIYNTVIIDTISELHRLLVFKFTGVDLNKVKLDEELEAMDSWREAQAMFQMMIRAFRTLPVHSFFLSAEAIEPAERNKKRNPKAGMALPKLAGQAAGEVASAVDMVGYLDLSREENEGGETKETRRLYLGAGYAGWISKHRFENLPELDYIESPTMQSLIDLARKDATHGTSESNTEPGQLTVASPSDTARAGTTQQRSSSDPSRGGGSGRRAGHGVRRRND